ncbi:PREDICTED: coiled-coil domain-containing protein 89-like isoform X1 [Acropora digitifera]|uniref:coiled-coil domain-containing protein 89-like isoform X1 n=2 Tax=Acropora digitifera TaxID=70779 RepID=UPI00077B0942|nr:PREDICTED: coiled-coil domain-containing protein 89-like isoform X1 [Acropora digitifera]
MKNLLKSRMNIREKMKSYELKMAALRTKMRDYLLVTVVRERDLQIHQLREEGKDLQNRYESAVVSERSALENLSSLEKKYSEQAKTIQQEMLVFQKNAEEQLNQSQEKFKLLSSEKEENQLKVLTLVKERDDFAQLALQRGKTLEEKQKHIAGLCLKLEETGRSLKESEDNFLCELQEMNANAQVLKLKNQLEDAERKQRDTQKEYDAYKRHMSALLAKEKEINNKLRVLIG